MTVYADVLFLVNFVFDAEILAIALKLSSKRLSLPRLLLSACVGGLQGVFVFIPYFRILCAPPSRFILPLVMTAVVFCPCSVRELLFGWLVFLTASFLFSGAAAFFSLGAPVALCLAVPVYLVACLVKRRSVRKTGNAVLVYRGKKLTETGFFDSGNMLFCGESPVILADRSVFERLFGKGFSITAAEEWADARDLRFVPYKALGREGIVRGIRLDFVTVNGKRYDNAVLGYSDEEFSDSLILNGIMI